MPQRRPTPPSRANHGISEDTKSKKLNKKPFIGIIGTKRTVRNRPPVIEEEEKKEAPAQEEGQIVTTLVRRRLRPEAPQLNNDDDGMIDVMRHIEHDFVSPQPP